MLCSDWDQFCRKLATAEVGGECAVFDSAMKKSELRKRTVYVGMIGCFERFVLRWLCFVS